MTNPDTWSGALSDLEAKAEIDSLGDLQQRRRQLLPEYASLRALHGPNGKWDAKRKSYLEAMKIKARLALKESGEKITDATVDAYAHADDAYVQFLLDGELAATRFVEVETSITELEERIENRKAVLYAWSRESQL